MEEEKRRGESVGGVKKETQQQTHYHGSRYSNLPSCIQTGAGTTFYSLLSFFFSHLRYSRACLSFFFVCLFQFAFIISLSTSDLSMKGRGRGIRNGALEHEKKITIGKGEKRAKEERGHWW